ncbi:MAG: GNAT family N-acetyltransferase [Streptosporangiaceae bacterium]|nr:GNAT family N-acetyltransferase [Streptosporangiaceae bacterium]
MTAPGTGAQAPWAARFVRRARAADAGDVARVQVACWHHAYAGIVPDRLLGQLTGGEAESVWRDRWRAAITSPPTSRHRVFVAVDDGQVAGFASAGPATDADRWPGTDGEIYELVVAPDRTRQGHGSRLLHAVADTAAEDGFGSLSIWVLQAAQALRRFLESAGWAADGATGELDVGVSVPVVRLHTAISQPG